MTDRNPPPAMAADASDLERYPPERAAQFARLVEQTAPPAENPCRCTCDRCVYGRRTRAEAA